MSELPKASVSINRHSDNRVYIDIQDDANFNQLIEVSMSFEEYAKVITGQSACKGRITRFLDQEAKDNLGKDREIKNVYCSKIDGYDKKKLKEHVLHHFRNNYEPDGWFLHNSGSASKQSGGLHEYTIYKYK